MAGYDILMIAVLAGTTLWGAFKGVAWQLAALASLIVSYFASYYLSDSLTSTGLFGDTAPWNRFAAMLTIYIITGIIIWMGFSVISGTIERIKLRDFDRQLGALFGLLKGVIFCVLITFFVVTLMPASRDQVINTRSGRYVAKLLHKSDAIMPPELHALLDPYIKRFEESMQPSNNPGIDPTTGRPQGQDPAMSNPFGMNPPASNPQPWSAGMPNLGNWGNSGNQVVPNNQVPNSGNNPQYGNVPTQPGYGQPSAPQYPPQNPGYGFPNPNPQNPYDGAGGQPTYSAPPLQPLYPQQAPYPQSYSPTPPAIDPPRYGDPGYETLPTGYPAPGYQMQGYQPPGYFPSQPPAQTAPIWGAQVPAAGAWIR
jgi:membrane protein required for colicin V production